MTPAQAVSLLAKLVASRTEFEDEEMHAALVERGVSERQAVWAYLMTQSAWGRRMFAGKGMKLPAEFMYLTDDEGECGFGRLANDPYFAEAMALDPKFEHTSGYKWLALGSV